MLPCTMATFYYSITFLSLLLTMFTRVFPFFSPRSLKSPPNLRDCLNLAHPCLQRRRFTVLLNLERPDVALYAIDPLLLLPTPPSPHCILKFSEHGSFWQPLATHSDERPRPRKSSRAQGPLNALHYPVIARAWLQEVIRWSGFLRCALIMRSKTRWCTVLS